MEGSLVLGIIITIVFFVIFLLALPSIYFYWSAYRGQCTAIGTSNSGFMLIITALIAIMALIGFVLGIILITVYHKKNKTMPIQQVITPTGPTPLMVGQATPALSTVAEMPI